MPRPFFLFAPGAGAPSSHPWMQKWKERISSLGRVALFDYPYMFEGRRTPDPLPHLIEAHRRALSENRGAEEEIFLIGKSMGGRVGCHVALVEKVTGLICLGYPLCAGGDPNRIRDKVLRDLNTPVLFVQGTRDPLCPLQLLESVRPKMKAPNTLHIVDGGDHSLMCRKRDLLAVGKTQDEIDQGIFDAIGDFVTRILEGGD